MYDQLVFNIGIEKPAVVDFVDRVKLGQDIEVVLVTDPIKSLRIDIRLAECRCNPQQERK